MESFFNKVFSKINQHWLVPYGMLLLSLSSWYCATCFVGTENAADEESRQNIAVDKETGGSYVVSEVSVIYSLVLTLISEHVHV